MILRPSAAPRWGVCPGSVALEALYPEDTESPAAREGTAAHWYTTEAIQQRYHGIGTLAPNGVPLDADMIEGGNLFAAEVLTTQAQASPLARLHVEQKFQCGLVHDQCEGTPDVVLIDGDNHRLWVWDYKYGHRYVDPWENRQLTCYAAGVLEAYKYDEADVCGWDCRLVIVQPRNFHSADPVREWRTLGWKLWAAIGKLSDAAHQAAQPDAPTLTGPQCQDCQGRWACDALARVGSYAMDLAGQNAPVELGGAALGRELALVASAIKRLEARQTGLEAVVESELRNGRRVPGWAMGAGQSREKWTQPVTDVLALGELFGKDLRKPLDAITPTQARKLLGVDGSVIDAYASRPPGAAKLVADDPRAADRRFQQD
ncbi:MAG: DUF2800 domain-containing protein [Caulobacteraceae bacterium]